MPNWFFSPPKSDQFSALQTDYINQTLSRANEIVNDEIRLFEGILQPLRLKLPEKITHWTVHERSLKNRRSDIKYIWEPARFNWAILLAKAYFFSGDERYLQSFIKHWKVFYENNPVNAGPNWQSGQEIALRLIALVISMNLFKSSPYLDKDFQSQVITSIAEHAQRITLTICYSKAQNNNHLLSEAVGLYTAGVFLPSHPKSNKWRKLGKRWFNQAILSQIDDRGEYIQHSTNYHRMILTLCVWMQLLMASEKHPIQSEVFEKIKLAVGWLVDLLDETSGQVPNLGHNDGSFILPFTNCDYSDFRPIIQAASLAFLNQPWLGSDVWDDLAIWFGIPLKSQRSKEFVQEHFPRYLRLGTSQNWATMRAVRYSNRPAHADQLHVEIWHKGINLLSDAGTFQYNADPPWDNRLSSTHVHNTVSINNQDQMVRAGLFLWLDWANAEIKEETSTSITAFHEGYKKLGVTHYRTLEILKSNDWLIVDRIQPIPRTTITKNTFTLHWLTSDWPYMIKGNSIEFDAPYGRFSLEFSSEAKNFKGMLNIIRAGISLTESDASPILGWQSPTYGCKVPALSIQYRITALPPISLTTLIRLNP